MIFTAPTVDPEEPPITIKTIMTIKTEGAHDANSLGLAIFAPVVVIAETIWNTIFIGAICVINATIIPLIAMLIIMNLNWTSFIRANLFSLYIL